MSSTSPVTISVITPCFNEESNLDDCHRALSEVFAKNLADYRLEHIFCDNASSDRSVEILREMAKRDPNVKVILNARNYGPFRSTFNGLRHASGDAIVVLDSDLQDPPELIPTMVEKWQAGYHVVYAQRTARHREGPEPLEQNDRARIRSSRPAGARPELPPQSPGRSQMAAPHNRNESRG